MICIAGNTDKHKKKREPCSERLGVRPRVAQPAAVSFANGPVPPSPHPAMLPLPNPAMRTQQDVDTTRRSDTPHIRPVLIGLSSIIVSYPNGKTGAIDRGAARNPGTAMLLRRDRLQPVPQKTRRVRIKAIRGSVTIRDRTTRPGGGTTATIWHGSWNFSGSVGGNEVDAVFV